MFGKFIDLYGSIYIYIGRLYLYIVIYILIYGYILDLYGLIWIFICIIYCKNLILRRSTGLRNLEKHYTRGLRKEFHKDWYYRRLITKAWKFYSHEDFDITYAIFVLTKTISLTRFSSLPEFF